MIMEGINMKKIKMNWIDYIRELVTDGYLKGLTYNHLVLGIDNYKNTNIRELNLINFPIHISMGNDNKNYLVDMSKVKWDGKESLKVIEETFKFSGVIKEIDLKMDNNSETDINIF